MFFALTQINRSLLALGRLHPFFGITFLVCKKNQLPVGSKVLIPLDSLEAEFLKQNYRLDPTSPYFSTPFRTSNPKNRWLSPQYASHGSQKTRTQGDLAQAFDHDKDTNVWGWKSNYISILKSKLVRDKSFPLPIYFLAVWLYRNRDWGETFKPDSVIDSFIKEFHFNETEIRDLCDIKVPVDLPLGPLSEKPVTLRDLVDYFGRAPDSKPEEGGTLRSLELNAIGPSRSLEFEPGERLTVITGDNGLGKTFILECAWWALTGNWAESPASPREDAKRNEPTISFQISGKAASSTKTVIRYDWVAQSWLAQKGRPTIPGLIVYARVDGSFAVWDPLRHLAQRNPPSSGEKPGTFSFSRDDVLRGRAGRIEGILRDWVNWQRNPDQSRFESFRRVLERLSPPDMQPLAPGDPKRIPGEVLEIPTLRHPYGDVPILHESAGVRRIVTIAYLLVWSWNEHKVAASQAKRPPQHRIVILIDEMEAHLHPRWQRIVLPAILDVTLVLSHEVEAQVIATTHSPLVLASLESQFKEESDKLFHLHLKHDGEVTFSEVPFVRHGRVDAWLTSDIFEMREARSTEAEKAIRRAEQLMSKKEPQSQEIEEATKELENALTSRDEFWPRWFYFAKTRGVSSD